jgi:hypothetical protein
MILFILRFLLFISSKKTLDSISQAVKKERLKRRRIENMPELLGMEIKGTIGSMPIIGNELDDIFNLTK